jgi:putative intracellular protease/amidase
LQSREEVSIRAIVMIADGFNEIEAIGILQTLRDAGICSKSVGLTSGLIKGAHGILVRPDLVLADLPEALDIEAIALIVLPGGDRHLSHLERDPRVHRLVRGVASHGVVAAHSSGVRLLHSVLGQDLCRKCEGVDLLWFQYGSDQSLEAFAKDVIRRLA